MHERKHDNYEITIKTDKKSHSRNRITSGSENFHNPAHNALSAKLAPKWKGPFRVVQQLNLFNY